MKESAVLAEAVSGDFFSYGHIWEWVGEMKTDDGLEGKFWTSIMRWVTFNESAAFENGVWIQNWAQWEDTEATGKYYQMACNVQFDNTKEVAPPANVVVHETHGTSIDADTLTGALAAPLLIGTGTTEDKKVGW